MVLTLADQYEKLSAFLKDQELDHYWHVTNIDRFERLLGDSTLTLKYREYIQSLLTATQEKLIEVTAIMNATSEQVRTLKALLP